MSGVTWCYCLLIVQLSLCSVWATNTSCPTWHYYNSATEQCECESLLKCSSDGNEVEIHTRNCATSSEQEDDYYIGSCPFRYIVNSTKRKSNRRGLLCGECKDGYGPAVYSLDQECADCSSILSR